MSRACEGASLASEVWPEAPSLPAFFVDGNPPWGGLAAGGSSSPVSADSPRGASEPVPAGREEAVQDTRNDVRNVAVVAHVDHGKTSVVDAMLWQARLFETTGDDLDRLRASLDPERDKALRVMVSHTSTVFRGTRVHLVDTPARSDVGGETDRALRLVEGILFVVDADEGPVPQVRFVLRKAFEFGLSPVVVVNKIDLPGARPAEVLGEIREMFVDLGADERQQDFAAVYCNARIGSCRRTIDGPEELMAPLFEAVLEHVPPPRYDSKGPLQFLVTGLDYEDFLGRLAVGRVFNGSLRSGDEVAHLGLAGSRMDATVGGVFRREGLDLVEIESAEPGDIVALSGIDSLHIGDTLSDRLRPEALPPVKVDEPTLAVVCSVSDSPLAGQEGSHLSAAKLRERLWREILTNTTIRVEETDSPDAFLICARSELQLAILLEMLRREGFELSTSRPFVLDRTTDGVVHEPVDVLTVDCPDAHVGVVKEKVIRRRGEIRRIVGRGSGRSLLECRMSVRGSLGFRNEFLNDTKGSGIMTQVFDGYRPCVVEVPRRDTGVLVADRPGRATAYAIAHLQARGTIFVAPGEEVYEGMIVGENSRPNDVDVNITKLRPTGPGLSVPEPELRLIPPRSMSLEQALEFVRDDELVEITPRTLRLRKKVLDAGLRARNS